MSPISEIMALTGPETWHFVLDVEVAGCWITTTGDVAGPVEAFS